ncbi:hypothetical protein [Flavobacterium sp.]|uniref:hypothetical protein n=1 Tax=Flavobacterium sp. TaxID=239 RepID=UPI001215A6F2|nr:hypothetical protein [Flavobacterium sp.]RZJ73521.1 MAG: hypothetical protein EOO49_01530 [Flavobacterium sp.]
MKKIFGVLLQLTGVAILVVSVLGLSQFNCERRIESIQNALNLNRSEEFESPQIAFLIVAAFGLVLFIIGLILLVTKTANQRKLEAELTTFRYLIENGFEGEDPLLLLEQLHELKRKGVITDAEFADLKRKMFE